MTVQRVTLPTRFPWQERLRCAVQGVDYVTGLHLAKRPKRVLALMGRRAGKSVGCSLESGEAALEKSGSKVFWGAHTADGCAIGHEIFHGPLTVDLGDGRREFSMFGPVVERPTVQPLQSRLIGGSTVYWRSMEGKGTAIGRGWDLAVIDEFDRIDPERIKRDVIPATADTGGVVIGITTPDCAGLGRDWLRRAQDGDGLYAYVQGPSTENPSPLVRAWVEEFRADVGEDDPLYRQEILAEYVEGQGRVFRNVRENARLKEWRTAPDPEALYVVGADVGEHRDFFVLVAMDARTGELHAFERARHLPWDEQAVVARQFAMKWGDAPIWIDSTGIGDAVYEGLMRVTVSVMPMSLQSAAKTNMITALRIAMSKGEIAYPPEPTLQRELEDFGYSALPSGRISYRAPKGKHDDWVTAVGLANWGRVQGMAYAGAGMAAYGWVA